MTPYYADESLTLWLGDTLDVLRTLPAGSVDCAVTSPPYYGLRDYGEPGQYGLEPSPAEYVETMRAVFAEVRRVLASDGTLWLNLGDSYAGSAETGRNDAQKIGRNNLPQYGSLVQHERRSRRLRVDYGLRAKNLLGMPWRVAFALQADGWILRNAIIWDKPNAMPESVRDRLSTTYELVFMFAKRSRYWFDLDAIREPLAYPEALDGSRVFGGKTKGRQGGVGSTERTRGHNVYGARHPITDYRTDRDHDAASPKGRNPGDVWTLPTQPFPEAHFAVMPPALAERCVLAGCRPGGSVLDPFTGSGTTGMVAQRHGRKFVGVDLNRDYLDLALRTRLAQSAIMDEVG